MIDEQTRMLREILIAAIREYSENVWAAGWMNGIERDLHRPGGKWEAMGRLCGWPTDYPGEDVEHACWRSWDEAGRLFASEPAPGTCSGA